MSALPSAGADPVSGSAAMFSPTGAVLGLVAGLGLVLVLARLPRLRRQGLGQRLAPYLRDATPASRLLADPGADGPLRVAEHLLAPLIGTAVGWLGRLSAGSDSVRRRLDQLGDARTTEQFRAEQVVWGLVGAACGAAVGVLLAAGRRSVLPVAGLVVVGGLAGVLGRDHLLTVRVRRMEQRILAEFPAVAELLALSVAAGEGAVGALERVARTCSGELAAQLRRALGEARTGASLVQALEGLARRTDLPSLARFVDGLAVALERGTPLADVLRAQAQDVREMTRRRLIESGGRREIAMMIPVVFLVLPVTVVFVVYPGLAVLQLNL
jgi:tight adherence protein C